MGIEIHLEDILILRDLFIGSVLVSTAFDILSTAFRVFFFLVLVAKVKFLVLVGEFDIVSDVDILVFLILVASLFLFDHIFHSILRQPEQVDFLLIALLRLGVRFDAGEGVFLGEGSSGGWCFGAVSVVVGGSLRSVSTVLVKDRKGLRKKSLCFEVVFEVGLGWKIYIREFIGMPKDMSPNFLPRDSFAGILYSLQNIEELILYLEDQLRGR